jgi:serine phosphatase RsbU (regulator of sigma subunit)
MVNKTEPKRKRGKKITAKPARGKKALAVDRQIKIQKALYEIATAASAVTDMQEFYTAMHRIVGKLMYARNFYVTLYDPATQMVSAPYFVDEAGDVLPPPARLDRSNKSLRAYVLHTGMTLHVSAEEIEDGRRRGKFTPMGTPAEDWIGVPLKIEEKTIGSLTVQSYKKGFRYKEQDVQVLEFVAQHIAVALTRARAIEETRQRNSELAIINSVQAALAAQLDMHGIFEAIGEKLREIFSYQDVTIYTGDLRSRIVTVEYSYELGQKSERRSVPMNSLYEYFMTSNKTFVFNGDLSSFAAKFSDYQNPEPPKSLLAVPVRRNKDTEPVVYLTIQDWDGKKIFSDSDVRLMETLANSMSVALENARLFDETQQRNAELAIINSVQEGLASKLEMQGIYDLVGDKIREIFDANTVTLVTFDLDKNILHLHYIIEKGRRLFIEPMPIPEIYMNFIRRGQPLLINNKVTEYIEGVDPGFKQLAGEMPRSVLAVPLTMKGEMFGLITLQNIDRENAFSESDMRLLQTLANSMSVALENARLWEQEKMFRKALQRELEIGREIQAGFLPEALPVVEGWEIAASLMSAREVAGDFYDAFELPDGTIGLVIADVCDKGVGAALFMTLFRSLIRAAANLDYFEHTEKSDTPHSSTERLQRAISLTNNYIAETHGESGMFATLFFGILDPRDGRLAYINGGHEPPLILHSGSVHEILRKTGPAVGAITDCHFDPADTRLQVGDMLFAFTDGAPDAKDPHGEFFGRERLLDILQRDNSSSHELIKTIETELHQYIAGSTQFDDITLLAVRRVH